MLLLANINANVEVVVRVERGNPQCGALCAVHGRTPRGNTVQISTEAAALAY
jgi:hypothetical protein